LHCLTRHRKSQKKTEPVASEDAYAQFDSPKLSSVLPDNGLPRGKVTVLTGDEATFKARFGRAFLAGGFSKHNHGAEVAIYLTTQNVASWEKLCRLLQCHLLDEARANLNNKQWLIFRQLEAHDLNSPTLFNIVPTVLNSLP
jgi:hypothetical protein